MAARNTTCVNINDAPSVQPSDADQSSGHSRTMVPTRGANPLAETAAAVSRRPSLTVRYRRRILSTRIPHRPIVSTLFLLLCLIILLSTPATSQPDDEDRKTNEDFMITDPNLALSLSLSPFQLRLFASEGSDLLLSGESVKTVRKITQRYLDDKMREMYTEQGYEFDYVRLKVLDSSVVSKGAADNDDEGRRLLVWDRNEEVRALRGRLRRSAQQQQQRHHDEQEQDRIKRSLQLVDDNTDDTVGTSITLGGGVTFAELPLPQQWKVGADFLSLVRQYDDLKDRLVTSSDDPVLATIDSIEVKGVAESSVGQQLQDKEEEEEEPGMDPDSLSLTEGQEEEVPQQQLDGGKEKLPPWMDEVTSGEAAKPENQDDEETDGGGGGGEESDIEDAAYADGGAATDWSDVVEDGDTDNTDSSGNEDDNDNDNDEDNSDGPQDYPTGTAVSSERGPTTASSSGDGGGGDGPSSSATIVIAILSVLLGLAAIVALSMLYVKRRRAQRADRDNKWAVNKVGKYESVITPKAGDGSSGDNLAANNDVDHDDDGKIIVASGTQDTSSPGATKSSPAISSGPSLASSSPADQSEAKRTMMPRTHLNIDGLVCTAVSTQPLSPTDQDAETPTASGSRQLGTPRPNQASLPRHASFCSASSGGTEALAEATGIARGGATSVGRVQSTNRSAATNGGAKSNNRAVVKMRSLVSGVTQPRSRDDHRPPIVPSGSYDETSGSMAVAAPLSASAQTYLTSSGSAGSPKASISALSQEEFQEEWGKPVDGSVSQSRNNRGARGTISASTSVASSSRPPQYMGPTAGAFPTAPGAHYVRRNSNRSGTSSSYQTSNGGEPHNSGAYPGHSQEYNDGLHPLDWSCRGSDTEMEDGEGNSISNSTLSEHQSHIDGTAYPAIPASLLGGGDGGRAIGRDNIRSPLTASHTNGHERNSAAIAQRNLLSPRTVETPSFDPTSPSAGTMTSGASSSDRSGGEPNQLIKDLLWLEGKIADVRAAKGWDESGSNGVDAKNQNHTALYSPLGKASTRDPYKDREAKRRKDTQSIVCRDCYAPPGKLHIVIHTTKDGPAIHSIREGSALEGHLFPEDLIVAVDDVDTRSYTAEEVIKALAAKVESERKITVYHFEDQDV